MTTYYPIALGEEIPASMGPRRLVQARTIGEFRRPKRGEWYMSGAIAYRAPSDLSTDYQIVELVVNTSVKLSVARLNELRELMGELAGVEDATSDAGERWYLAAPLIGQAVRTFAELDEGLTH